MSTDWRALARPATYPARRVELQELDADDYARPARVHASTSHGLPASVYADMRALQALVENAPLATWRIDGLKLPSVANLREHHMTKASRMKRQRAAAKLQATTGLAFQLRPILGTTGLVVLMVRTAPRPLDGDNLAASLKAVRDGIADALGVDDRNPGVAWVCAQEKGPEALRVIVVRGRP
jgi:hypothetical protein